MATVITLITLFLGSWGGDAPVKAGAANPVPAMGVQFHAMWSDYTPRQRRRVLDKMQSAGVTWVRIDMGWESLQERGPGALSDWYVELADDVIRGARKRGMQVLATLWWTPDWANGGRGRSAPPNDPSDYKKVAKKVAARFSGRIDAWEIWNEPNHSDFFTGSARDYARLLKAGYAGIKAGDPSAQVVLGGPSHNDTAWLAKVYANGAQGNFDVMSTHPYQGMADAAPETPDDGTKWTLSHVAAVHKLMLANGDGDKEIWFTEFGWSSHGNTAGMANWMRGVSPRKQGNYLVRTLKYVQAEFPYVTNVFWYNERDRKSGNVQVDNYGLLKRDLSAKPAYRKLKKFLGGS